MANAIEKRGALEIAHRAVQVCGQIFPYAIVKDLADNNPAAGLRGMLKTKPREHHAYVGHNELPEFLCKLEAYDGRALF